MQEGLHTISGSLAISELGFSARIHLPFLKPSSELEPQALSMLVRVPNFEDELFANLNLIIGVNYRLKESDICYIFEHADVDAILVDNEFLPLLAGFQKKHPNVSLIVDLDVHPSDHDISGSFNNAVLGGLQYDQENGGLGWGGLEAQAPDETAVVALAYTSGTTARPKGVEYTHRGAYMAAVGNVIESGLSFHSGRCRYLWTLPMFHAMGRPPSSSYAIVRLLIRVQDGRFPGQSQLRGELITALERSTTPRFGDY